MKELDDNRGSLTQNTLFLAILTFSNYLLYFLTVPYQTRVLGPDIFGKVGFAMAVSMYLQLVVDFGFMLSGTAKIAGLKGENSKISRVLSAVLGAKTFLTLAGGLILSACFLVFPSLRDDYILFILSFINVLCISFLPDFVYRGLEQMKVIVIRTVVTRSLFAALLFVLLRDKSQYLLVPGLMAAGNFLALVFAYFHLAGIGIRVGWARFSEILATLRESSPFFLSRAAVNIYTSTNIVVLGALYGALSSTVGLYSAVERTVTAAKMGMSPLSDSLYPYMVRREDYQLIRKVTIIGTLVIICGSIPVIIFAHDLMVLVFGAQYFAAGEYLRIMAVAVIVAFPGMILGYPVMTPLGIANQANHSVILAAVIQLIQIGALYGFGALTVATVCVATVITESAALMIRAFLVYRAVIARRSAE